MRPPKWTDVHRTVSLGDGPVSGDAEASLVRRAVAALNRGDIEAYLSGFALDCLRWVGGLGVALSVPDIRENLMQLFAAFDELHLDEDLLFGGDGHVCARWTLRGVHTGEYGASRRLIARSPWRRAKSTPSPGTRSPNAT
jgi:SnoaL-like polyketide cyclase